MPHESDLHLIQFQQLFLKASLDIFLSIFYSSYWSYLGILDNPSAWRKETNGLFRSILNPASIIAQFPCVIISWSWCSIWLLLFLYWLILWFILLLLLFLRITITHVVSIWLWLPWAMLLLYNILLFLIH